MNTAQISHALRSNKITGPVFRGVFAKDQVPSTILACRLRVNTDLASQPGSHWVAFYQEQPEVMEYFDSFGNEPKSLWI